MVDTTSQTNKVLCMFRYEGKSEGRYAWFTDSVMIFVSSPDEILVEFDLAIIRKRREGWPVGPYPKRWELTSYYPESHCAILH